MAADEDRTQGPSLLGPQAGFGRPFRRLALPTARRGDRRRENGNGALVARRGGRRFLRQARFHSARGPRRSDGRRPRRRFAGSRLRHCWSKTLTVGSRPEFYSDTKAPCSLSGSDSPKKGNRPGRSGLTLTLPCCPGSSGLSSAGNSISNSSAASLLFVTTTMNGLPVGTWISDGVNLWSLSSI